MRKKLALLLLLICFQNSIPIFGAETTVRLDVPAYNQQTLGLPTGCEIVTVAMILNTHTTAGVSELLAKMPYSQNPNLGYRGNPRTANGYTIFPPALLQVIGEYVDYPIDMSGCGMPELQEQLSAGYPLAVWVNGLGWNVHCIALTGYDEKGFYYNDPANGKKDVFISYSSFYAIWDKPIYDRVKGGYHDTRKALSYTLAEPEAQHPTVALIANGLPLETVAPSYAIDGVVMIPLLEVAEKIDSLALSADEAQQNIRIVNGRTGAVIEIFKDSDLFLVNGAEYRALAPVQELGGVLYVPIQMLLSNDSFGYDAGEQIFYIEL